MQTTLVSHVPTLQALAGQVVLFLRQRMASYVWTIPDPKIKTEHIMQLLRDGDDIGYSALASKSVQVAIRAKMATVTLACKYHEDMAQMQYVQTRIPAIVNPIMRAYQSNHARVLQFHDWVVKNFRYDHTRTHYSAYAGLAKGVTVCNGYAMMFAYLCREANIPCQIAAGDVHKHGRHAWNMVELDGVWYHIDTTWDSPQSDSLTAYVPYNYYMLTDGEMAMTRKVGMRVHSRKTPTARTTYAEVLQRMCMEAHPHISELEQIRMRTGLIYTEPRYTITDRNSLRDRVISCLQKGLTQETVRYMVNMRKAYHDVEWVRAHLPKIYASYASRMQASFHAYRRAGNEHSLVMFHFR